MDSELHAMSCLLQSPGPGLDDTFSDFTNPHTVRSPEPEVLRQQLTDYTPVHLAATESRSMSLTCCLPRANATLYESTLPRLLPKPYEQQPGHYNTQARHTMHDEA